MAMSPEEKEKFIEDAKLQLSKLSDQQVMDEMAEVVKTAAAVLNAVRVLHASRPWVPEDEWRHGLVQYKYVCSHCNVAFPCETVVVVGKAMGLEINQ